MTLRILVTGASGFVGSALVPALVRGGHRVRAASRKQSNCWPAEAEWVQLWDLSSPADWSPLLIDVDVVIHLAGMAHRTDFDTDKIDRVNRAAIAGLVVACEQHTIKRLILMSSAGVQSGLAPRAAVSELDPPAPVTAYDRAKLAAEGIVLAGRVPYTILRPVVVYGRGAKANVAQLIRLARLPVPLPFGSLKSRRSLLAIENLISAIAKCLDDEQTLNETFLVADPEPISISSMFAQIRCGLGRRPLLLPIPPVLVREALQIVGRSDLWSRLGQDFVVDASKLQKAGWCPLVSTEDGLRMIGASYGPRSR